MKVPKNLPPVRLKPTVPIARSLARSSECSMIVFTSITLERQREDLLENFERKMARCPEVMQCYFVSGDADYLVVVSVADMDRYNEFARRVFANEPNIRMFRSSFCLSRVKYDTKIPVE